MLIASIEATASNLQTSIQVGVDGPQEKRSVLLVVTGTGSHGDVTQLCAGLTPIEARVFAKMLLAVAEECDSQTGS